jgi:chromosome segregation ATPase
MLTSLRIKNFKNFCDEQHLVIFRPEEDACALSVLIGKNGSGKSSTFDAIEWAVFQRSPKSLRATKQEDLISDGKDFASVKASFKLRDGSKSLDITREVRKGKQSRSFGVLQTTSNENLSTTINHKLNCAEEIATALLVHFYIDLANFDRILIKQQCISSLSCAKTKPLLNFLELFIGTDKISVAANICYADRDRISSERMESSKSGEDFLHRIKELQPAVDDAVAIKRQKNDLNSSFLQLHTAERQKLIDKKGRLHAKSQEIKDDRELISGSIQNSLKSIDMISNQLKILDLKERKASRVKDKCICAIEENDLDLIVTIAARKKSIQRSILDGKKMKELQKLVSRNPRKKLMTHEFLNHFRCVLNADFCSGGAHEKSPRSIYLYHRKQVSPQMSSC